MKVALALALFAYFQSATCNKQIFTALSHASRIRRSVVDMHQGGRFKRQPMICMRRCGEEMEEKTADIENFDALFTGRFNPTMELDENMLGEFCDVFESYRTCLDSCGDFPSKEMMMDIFKIPDYICVEHFDDFIQAIPCYQKMEPKLENCLDKCGGEGYLDDQDSKMETLRKSGDIEGMMDMFGGVCGFMSCLFECQRPVSLNVCGDTKAADLLQGIASMAMNESKIMFDRIGKGSLFPTECSAMVQDQQQVSIRHPTQPTRQTSTTSVQLLDVCEQPKVVGKCQAAIARFYYNKQYGTCVEFLYGGCDANQNNFEQWTQCMNRCGPKPEPPPPTVVPKLPKCQQEGAVVGPCRSSMIKYYYDQKSKSCRVFLYGGCKGNDNRFESYTDCNTECVQHLVDGSQRPKFYLQQEKGSSSLKMSMILLFGALLFVLFRRAVFVM